MLEAFVLTETRLHLVACILITVQLQNSQDFGPLLCPVNALPTHFSALSDLSLGTWAIYRVGQRQFIWRAALSYLPPKA